MLNTCLVCFVSFCFAFLGGIGGSDSEAASVWMAVVQVSVSLLSVLMSDCIYIDCAVLEHTSYENLKFYIDCKYSLSVSKS